MPEHRVSLILPGNIPIPRRRHLRVTPQVNNQFHGSVETGDGRAIRKIPRLQTELDGVRLVNQSFAGANQASRFEDLPWLAAGGVGSGNRPRVFRTRCCFLSWPLALIRERELDFSLYEARREGDSDPAISRNELAAGCGINDGFFALRCACRGGSEGGC